MFKEYMDDMDIWEGVSREWNAIKLGLDKAARELIEKED